MTAPEDPPLRTRLKIYRFGLDSVPAGEIVGAVERMALTGQARVQDALCVVLSADGELAAIDLALARAGAGLSDLLDFRLAPNRRRVLTARTLTTRRHGVAPSIVRAIGDGLEPGSAMIAFLLTARATQALDEAVARCHGQSVADEPTRASTLSELGALLVERSAPVRP